ncbi:MAG: ABC transporter ATP-binding protein [Phycisphaerae bacterium]|nr:ABC transporter ATP-binding protein [Phycisphaerae bacterium]
MPPSTPEPVVRLDSVVKVYQPAAGVEVPALRGVSFTIYRGEYIAIVGPSGSGKSTLLNILGCLDRPTSGTYWLDGHDVSRFDDDALSDIRGRRIGFVFQSFNLIATQTVLENLETPLYYQGFRARERKQMALQLIERVGLADRAEHRPHELSGGQQQRVAIARALANDPAILLADEPTGNLDSKTGQLILQMLDELNAAGRTVIIVTHDMNVARRCGRVVELSDGLIQDGGSAA